MTYLLAHVRTIASRFRREYVSNFPIGKPEDSLFNEEETLLKLGTVDSRPAEWALIRLPILISSLRLERLSAAHWNNRKYLSVTT
jgi:hypothetical protein